MEHPDLLQLRRLAIFAIVVEKGSFAQAAQSLQMSRSAVSEQVALLEAGLGVRLLQRTTRQLTLTTEGRMVYPEAAQLNNSMQSITNLVNQDQPQGRVRITTTPDLAVEWLNPRLVAFQEQYPDIYFDLVIHDQELDLVAHQIDVAVRIGRLDDESYIARPLFHDQSQVMASTRYLERQTLAITPDTLEEHTWILLRQLNPGNRVSLQCGTQQISFIPKHYHLSDSPLTMRSQLQLGLGIGLHLPSTVPTTLNEGTLQVLLPDWYGERFTCSLVYPSRRQLPLRVRCLLDFLKPPLTSLA